MSSCAIFTKRLRSRIRWSVASSLAIVFFLTSAFPILIDVSTLPRCQAADGEALGDELIGTSSGGRLVQQALDKAANFPWYDSGSGELRSVIVPKNETPPNVRQWEWPRWFDSWDWDWDLGIDLGSVFGTVFEILMWLLLFSLIAAIVVMLARAYLESEGFWATETKGANAEQDDRRSDAERIENLPFETQVKRLDLLSETKQLAESGRYGEAIVYLFGYQLVQLDKNHLIRLTKGKTNRQYLRELRTRSRLRQIMSRSTIAFEDYFFGRHSIDRSRFDQVWHELDAFHDLAKPDVNDSRQVVAVASDSGSATSLEVPS